jgi:hypothetical protein
LQGLARLELNKAFSGSTIGDVNRDHAQDRFSVPQWPARDGTSIAIRGDLLD